MKALLSREQYYLVLMTILCISHLTLCYSSVPHKINQFVRPITTRFGSRSQDNVVRNNFLDKFRKNDLVLNESPTTSTSTGLTGSNGANTKKKERNKMKIYITLWVHVVSIFMIVNHYRSRCWPAALVQVPLPVLSLVHAVCAMLFSGAIITTTILEWIVVRDRTKSVNKFWFLNVPTVESAVVLPALTGSIISGIGQAFINYGSFKLAPKHIKSSFHLLLLFGIWWGFTDRRSQETAKKLVLQDNDGSIGNNASYDIIPPVFQQRRVSNLVSCGFLIVMYAMMVLKPGYAPVKI